jgi:hypothetical protein
MTRAGARACLGIFVLAAAAACAGSPAPPPAAPQPAAKTWKDMTRQVRGQYMGEVVLPKMKALFQNFDAQHFSVVDCATCHGPGAEDRTFSMPNGALSRLPDNAAGFQALAREKPGWMQFMAKQVRPQMAALLGKEEIDMRNPKPDAFGCRDCHVLGDASGSRP